MRHHTHAPTHTCAITHPRACATIIAHNYNHNHNRKHERKHRQTQLQAPLSTPGPLKCTCRIAPAAIIAETLLSMSVVTAVILRSRAASRAAGDALSSNGLVFFYCVRVHRTNDEQNAAPCEMAWRSNKTRRDMRCSTCGA